MVSAKYPVQLRISEIDYLLNKTTEEQLLNPFENLDEYLQRSGTWAELSGLQKWYDYIEETGFSQ